MGQASRTTKLLLDLSNRSQGGANSEKRAALEETAKLLDAARAFYVAYFLAHAEKVTERVPYFSEPHQAMREGQLSADTLLTWTEFQTVETAEHPYPLPDWNFSQAFPHFPFVYRRSVIKDAIGRVRSYLSNLANWRQGERFSLRAGRREKTRGGKLFRCLTCGYEANADHNASVNLHHSFYREYCWHRKPKSTKGSGHSP